MTDYSTNKRQLARQYTSVSVGDDVTLEVVYPSHLLLGVDPMAVVVGIRAGKTAVFSPPLIITLDSPPSVSINDAIQGTRVFRQGNGKTETFLLANTAVLPLRQRQTLTLTHSLALTPTLLTIDVEAPQTAAWRGFIVGTISDKSPLLLTLAAVLPIAALIFPYLQKQEERAEAAHQQRKKELVQQLQQLRDYLAQADPARVAYVWRQIEPLLPGDVVSERDYKWLNYLQALSQGNHVIPGGEGTDWLVALKKEWTTEFVGALVCAEEHVIAHTAAYRPLFQNVALDQVTHLRLRNKFVQLWSKIDSIPYQYWAQEFPINADVLENSQVQSLPLPDGLQADPLLYDRAEDEETSLFAQDGFWFRHPAYSAVANATGLQVVSGAKGCGRTALARGLCYNESRWSRYFWCYLPLSGAMTVTAVRLHVSRQLLDYIISRATLLLPIQEDQRQLMAGILVNAWSKPHVRAELEKARTRQPWLQQANPQQRPIWQAVGGVQLALLQQAVEATPSTGFSDLQWAGALLTSFQALNFRGLRLVLDGESGSGEATTALLPVLQEWQQAGLVTTLFIPENESIPLPESRRVQMNWSQAELEKLFAHRLLRLAECSAPIMPFSSQSVYEAFFFRAADAPATPRKLAHLWQQALAKMSSEKIINQEALDLAAGQLDKAERGRQKTATPKYNKERLIALMDEAFNDQEIRDLCPALHEDYDNLAGENKRGKIRELVLLMNRTGRLPDLVSKCQAERPSINWA